MTLTGLCMRAMIRASTLAISGAARGDQRVQPPAGRSITALTASNLLGSLETRRCRAPSAVACDNAGAIGHGQADRGWTGRGRWPPRPRRSTTGRALEPAPARNGYRAGLDAALLAAACDARPGERVLEAGCGVGAVDAGRPHFERPAPNFSAWSAIRRAGRSGAREHRAQRPSRSRERRGWREFRRRPGRLRWAFDRALANPPFFDDPTALRDPRTAKRGAWLADGGLEAWTEFLTEGRARRRKHHPDPPRRPLGRPAVAAGPPRRFLRGAPGPSLRRRAGEPGSRPRHARRPRAIEAAAARWCCIRASAPSIHPRQTPFCAAKPRSTGFRPASRRGATAPSRQHRQPEARAGSWPKDRRRMRSWPRR